MLLGPGEIAGFLSSSQDQSFDETSSNFRDSSHTNLLFNDFSNGNTANGRNICRESLIGFGIEEYLMNQRWESLLNMGDEIYPMYIWIFFSNMTVGYDQGFTITSLVGRKDIIHNTRILSDILGIPHQGDQVYDLKTWPLSHDFDYGPALNVLLGGIGIENIPRKIHANQLDLTSRILHLICFHNVRGGDREEVSFTDVYLIEHLLKNKLYNLPYIVLRHIEEVHGHKKNLPYGLL